MHTTARQKRQNERHSLLPPPPVRSAVVARQLCLMSTQQTPVAQARPTVSGKFFRLGNNKFYLKGVTYGPFRPNSDGDPFPNRLDTQRDFEILRSLNANFIRVYNVPPRWLLDLA